MTINNAVSAMAGVVIIFSVLMYGVDFSEPNWLWLTLFVGVNLLQSAFTGFCPAALIFKATGLKDSDGSCCK
ncbi:Rhodanese-related sulfurtransferase [uncultured Candidatus Thioglobus sp.]|nr:Rhodanese-related sulfurtransferase [uncultured Candidatus Thioglobus sp.]SMM99895.1 Rhodanese-related sulfurtransferase [uncultured Candidatus Thioglobus sp.]